MQESLKNKLIGRMPLFRRLEREGKTDRQILEALRKRFPWGLTGDFGIEWVRIWRGRGRR
jgi:hypothetical protein